MPGALLTVERIAIAAATTLTTVLFLPALADPVNVVKLTLLVSCALVAGVCAALRVLRSRVVSLPRSAAFYTAIVLLLCLLIVTFTADNTTTAVVGTYGRNNGLLAYAAALLLFSLGTRAWNQRTTPIMLIAVLAGGLFTSSYGLLQYRGLDPINWNNPFNPIIGSLGNPDFASAYLGLCVPVAVWGALWDGWPRPLRIVSGVVGALCLTAAALSSAVQGPAAAVVGTAVLVVAWLLNQGGATARRGLAGMAGLTALGAALVAAGAAHAGPLTAAFAGGSGKARAWYWQGASAMLRDHPVFGVGLGHYGAHWRQVRPDAATRRLGGAEFSDAAHSVPLQMFAEGGVLLGIVYLAFLAFVGVALVRGLRSLDGPGRMMLGAAGGVWLAYVVQAAVSIDQVPLLTVGFVAAGVIVALSGRGVREFRLRGAVVHQQSQPNMGRRPRSAVPRVREWTGADSGLAAGLVSATLIAFWFSLYPLRANAAVRSGDVRLANGNGNAALEAYQRANALLPGVGQYWMRTGSLLEQVKQPRAAFNAYRRGAEADPVNVGVLVAAARLAGQFDTQLQGRLLRRAGWLDPTNPATVLQVAAYDAAHGALPAAAAAVDRALRALPDNADLWAAKGEIQVRRNDEVGARAAFQRALTIQPGEPVATKGLAALEAS